MTAVADSATVARRGFLKGLSAVAAAGAVAPSTTLAATPGRQVQYGMLVDSSRCTGCQACSVACKAEFEVPLGVTRSWVESVERGDFPKVSRKFLPRLCNHCRNPVCTEVCPTQATYKRKEDGVVVVDGDKCIACGRCIDACPYEARFMNPVTGVADKCDFCIHRVAKGVAPACVETCMARARVFGDINNPDAEIAKRIAKSKATMLMTDKGTAPSVYYVALDPIHDRASPAGEYVRVDSQRRPTEVA